MTLLGTDRYYFWRVMNIFSRQTIFSVVLYANFFFRLHLSVKDILCVLTIYLGFYTFGKIVFSISPPPPFSPSRKIMIFPYVLVSNEFQRKGDSSTTNRHKLPVPVYGRYFRFYPTQRYGWNCLRVEIYRIIGE